MSAPGLPAQRVAVTMRTPGHDFELAAGWLVHEGVTTPDGVRAVRYCTDTTLTELEEFNVVTVDLATPPLSLPTARLVNSACGVCGTDSVAGRHCRRRPRLPGLARPADGARASPTGCGSTSRVSARQVACMPRGSSRSTGPRSSYARTSGGTTPSTRSSARASSPASRCRPCSCSAAASVSSWSRRPSCRASPPSWPSALRPPSRSRSRRTAGMILVGFNRSQRCVVYAGADRRRRVTPVMSVASPSVAACASCTPPTGTSAGRSTARTCSPCRRAYVDHLIETVEAEASTWWSSPGTSTTVRSLRSMQSPWPTTRSPGSPSSRARVVATSGNHDSARRLGSAPVSSTPPAYTCARMRVVPTSPC